MKQKKAVELPLSKEEAEQVCGAAAGSTLWAFQP